MLNAVESIQIRSRQFFESSLDTLLRFAGRSDYDCCVLIFMLGVFAQRIGALAWATAFCSQLFGFNCCIRTETEPQRQRQQQCQRQQQQLRQLNFQFVEPFALLAIVLHKLLTPFRLFAKLSFRLVRLFVLSQLSVFGSLSLSRLLSI